MENINKSLISFIAKPLMLLMLVAVLSTVFLTVAYSQTTTLLRKNKEDKALETKLAQKVTVLQKVSTILSDDVSFLDVVVPNRASVLYAMSQVKNQALKYGLIVSNLKTGSPSIEKNDISKTSITFDIEGQESSIFEFAISFQKILPLMKIDKIKINTSGSLVRATVTLFVYSAPLPKTIPSVSSTTAGLTDSEIKIITDLSTYALPTFIEPNTTMDYERLDPFN